MNTRLILNYLSDLNENNNREWYHAHKAEYKAANAEFEELIRQKAVALKYNPDKNGAPVIVASGMGYLAERITETAMEAGVPVYEDDSLATLLTQLQLGAEIPQELYQAIVDIYLYFLGYVPDKEETEDKNLQEEEEPVAAEEEQSLRNME